MTSNTVTIDGSAIGILTIGTDNGSIVVDTSTTISVNGGNGIATRQNGNQIIADIEAGALSFDTNPTLGGTLDGNGNNMVGIDNITANNVNALVYDTDIRAVSSFPTGFDFKGIPAQVNNMVHFILATDVDYGTIASEASFSSDFGTFKGNEWQTIGVEKSEIRYFPREGNSTSPFKRNKCNYKCNRYDCPRLTSEGATLVGTPLK